MTENNDRSSQLAFYVSSEAWYWDATRKRDVIAELMVTRREPDGGCFWEFAVEWHRLQSTTACRIGIFDDAFVALTEIPQFFSGMAAMTEPSVEDVKGLLLDLGFADVTERESPHRRMPQTTLTAGEIINALNHLAFDDPVTVAKPDSGGWLNIVGVTVDDDEPSALILTRDDFEARQ